MRPIGILASVVVPVVLLAAAACGGQEASPSGTAATTAPAPAPAATVDTTPATTPAAEPLPSTESDLAEVAEETVGSPPATDAPAAEPVEVIDPTPDTTAAAEPLPSTEPDALDPSDAGDATGVVAGDLAGRWEGVTVVPGLGDLPFSVTFRASDDGLRATIDIQGAVGLRLSNVSLESGRVHFELESPLGLATWEGQVRGGVIEGEFLQGGFPATFRLERADDPRVPAGVDSMYRREVVVFSNGEIVLAGELTFPEGDGPHPAVVLISGSGDQDRDSNLLGFPMFAVLADHLAQLGVASLRFDDRGVGGSTGDGLLATIEDRAGDVEAAVDLLVARDDIDAGGIGLVGHSEGGIVAPLVANRTESVAFVVLLAAPAVSAAETLSAQQRQLLDDAGATAEQIEQAQAFQQQVFSAVATGRGWDEVEASIRALARQQLEALSEDLRNAIPDDDAYLDAVVAEELASLRSVWFASFFDYDPRPAVVALSVPILALYGELDTQVPAEGNSAAMAEAIAESDIPSHALATIPSANHLFQAATTGSVNEYAELEPEFVPELLEILATWLEAGDGT